MRMIMSDNLIFLLFICTLSVASLSAEGIPYGDDETLICRQSLVKNRDDIDDMAQSALASHKLVYMAKNEYENTALRNVDMYQAMKRNCQNAYADYPEPYAIVVGNSEDGRRKWTSPTANEITGPKKPQPHRKESFKSMVKELVTDLRDEDKDNE